MIVKKIRSLPLPPVKNIFNVAVQTARQTMPDKPNREEYSEPQGGRAFDSPKQQNVHFSDETQPQTMSHHELNPFNSLNPFANTTNPTEIQGQDCTSFIHEEGYQRTENYLNR